MIANKIKPATEKVLRIMSNVYAPDGSKDLFDEVLFIQSLPSEGRIKLIWYVSIRTQEEIRKSFIADLQSIKAEMLSGEYHPGDLHVDQTSGGSIFDAFICVGNDYFLVFNNVKLSMEEVKQHGNWLLVQPIFWNFAEQFRT